MSNNKTTTRYIIRKYVVASTIQEAIKKESQAPVSDCWVDEEFKANNEIGFKVK